MQQAIHRYTKVYKPYLNQVSIRNNHNSQDAGTSASTRLFADAAREEVEAQSQPRTASRIPLLENQYENWTGDESMHDTVLRMLVDKYKPLRSGSIQSAEQRLKQNPPRVWSSDQISTVRSTGSWATQPLLPSSEDHRPWHTQFKAPSHATSSIKHANIPPVSARKPSITPIDDRARRKEKEAKQKEERVRRLAQARESILDYRLGIKRASDGMRRSNPLSLKGWSGLIEDKIQAARSKGLFKTVKGRGQPIVRHIDESNPFIAREEFLMNRIVQRNGAAPPWVEVQGELDAAIYSFREILRQSWIRQAVRNLTTNNPPALLHTFTLQDIKVFRDPEWEQRERSYHEVVLKEVNSLVRKYNGVAPYAVRRPFYVRDVEMERVLEACAEDISRELAERAKNPVANANASEVGEVWSIGDHLRQWVERVFSTRR